MALAVYMSGCKKNDTTPSGSTTSGSTTSGSTTTGSTTSSGGASNTFTIGSNTYTAHEIIGFSYPPGYSISATDTVNGISCAVYIPQPSPPSASQTYTLTNQSGGTSANVSAVDLLVSKYYFSTSGQLQFTVSGKTLKSVFSNVPTIAADTVGIPTTTTMSGNISFTMP